VVFLPERQQVNSAGTLRSVVGSPKAQELKVDKQGLKAPIPHILVVDDEPLVRQQLERLYTHSGHTVTTVASAEEAIERLAKGDIDIVVTDIRLPGLSGIELTKRIRETSSEIPVIVITGFADIETAVEVLKLGASDYVVKPFSAVAIQEATRAAAERAQVFTEIRHLRSSLNERGVFAGMHSQTPEMHRVFEIIRLVAETDITVLVEGETGTGKELVASAIHHQSPRGEGPFVTINCAGIPETLLESELFGYERGAFTGADQARPGKIELAQGGTLFLDEIESMSVAMQAKLLRVLEAKRVQRLGGRRTIQVDMRVIAASNVPLKELVSQEQMRSDFYYRISVVPINLIPLRERRVDIPLLAQEFLRHHSVANHKRITSVSGQVMSALMGYHWPGNIRELQNVLEKSIVLTTGRVIERVDLPHAEAVVQAREGHIPLDLPLRQWLNEQEKNYLIQRLKSFGGRIGLTAQNCGVDVKTLYRKMRFYGLHKTNH